MGGKVDPGDIAYDAAKEAWYMALDIIYSAIDENDLRATEATHGYTSHVLEALAAKVRKRATSFGPRYDNPAPEGRKRP